VWRPSTPGTFGCSLSWGLSCPSTLISAIRAIVKKRKSAGTYYVNIVVAFDGGTGAAGSAYSPNATAGAGNPGGDFGSPGKNVNGVWVPARRINYQFDAFCGGTGSAVNCSIENVN
jgi:hypothetical protein